MIVGGESTTMAGHEDKSSATLVERDYRPRDLEALLHIEAHAGDSSWTRETFQWFLNRRNTAVRVITTSALPRTPIAFYAVEENVEVVYLANIAVAPEWRRKSVGTFALARIVERARQDRFARIELHVQEENLAAQLLYKKSGFVAVDIVRQHYHRQDGYAMRRELWP